MSFEQLKRKKAGPATTAAPQKAAASPKNVPEKPPGSAPQTSLQDVKKFVQSDKKSAKAEGGKEKPVELKAAPVQPKIPIEKKEKEKPSSAEPKLAQLKPEGKRKSIEEI